MKAISPTLMFAKDGINSLEGLKAIALVGVLSRGPLRKVHIFNLYGRE